MAVINLSEDLRSAITAGDLDTVESEWLSRLADDPSDLDFFLSVTRALSITDEEQRLSELLELLDEQLVERQLWETRLDLVRQAGKHYLKSGRVHATVLDTLRGLYSDRSEDLEELLEMVGLDKGKDATTKLWDRVERLKNLLAFQVGTIVEMKDQGVGVVAEVNLALQSLKVDFDQVKGLAVGLRAAGKMLDILPEGHILRRRVEAPEELAELRSQRPEELLRLALESYDRPLTGSELRQVLTGIVDGKSWNSWWSSVRKHPQLVIAGGSRQTYAWAATTEDASDAAWQAFEEAEPRRKIDQLRRAQDPELQQRMAAALDHLGRQAIAGDPALAFEIWAALERAGHAEEELTDESLLQGVKDPIPLVEGLSTRSLREQAYESIRRYRDDWQDLYERAMRSEPEPKALDLLFEALVEADEKRARKLQDQLLADGARLPAAFVWVAERTAEDAELRQRRAARLLTLLLRALGDDSFAPYRTRLEVLGDSGGTLPRLLDHLSAEEAAEAEGELESAQGLPDYQRQPLLNALHLRFPELHKKEQTTLYTIASSLEAKRSELKKLLEEEIPANRRAIQEARELGDLRENFEYKSARQRHEYLSARATSLNEQISRAKPLDPKNIDASQIRIGTRSRLAGNDGTVREITILGPWESRPEEGVVSYESELAQHLLGKGLGDRVEIDGVPYDVADISPFE